MPVPEVKTSKYGNNFDLPFRGLPAEIGMMIWNFSVPEIIKLRKSQFLPGHGPDSDRPRFKKARPSGLVLLEVSPMVQREFVEAARGKVVFNLDMLPDEAMEALPKKVQSIVGTIRCPLLTSDGSTKYGIRDLTYRPLTKNVEFHLRFSQLHTIHVDIFSKDWGDVAKRDVIKSIVWHQYDMLEQRFFDRQDRAHGRNPARDWRRLVRVFRRTRHEEDEFEDSDDDTILDRTLGVRILRDDTDAVNEAWDLRTAMHENYHMALFKLEAFRIPQLFSLVYHRKLSKLIIEFHDMTQPQFRAFQRFRGAILSWSNKNGEKFNIEVQKSERQMGQGGLCRRFIVTEC